ncbi:DNA ligase D [Prosthecomicrobium pneumaticum]|uniref:DNA ligase (ATP) n=1 Tax=Prosthecomicrobium pneumaticum TaxID=81895 RepID=A0A7W9FQJ6_9HYPH|nr:DNA ligase D [Prosthecomicrobium pneumaticum]MBB5754931.1 bifunctional non-homologous end joining protein LigD [Prosthecomicrobium pneumaticum]
MALDTYRRKRNFAKTAEPSGAEPQEAKGDSFVVQKHDATRLHYDFRLEMDGVLKSWAVTRGPSLDPAEKRLAVHVEDHPLEYGGFEGTIPAGEYGGGTVILWDRGRWTPIGDAAKGYAKGHLDFELDGEKLKGRWHLVRMAHKPREKKENWLLIKGDDAYAQPGHGDVLIEDRPESVKTGRVIAEVEDEAPGWSSKTGRIDPPAKETSPFDPAKLKGAKKGKLPDFLRPALATLGTKAPKGKSWLHEIKFDGYRLQARIEKGAVRLLTRSGLDWTKRFGKAVPAALAALPVETALIDGELVVESAAGASDFSALQADLSEGRADRFVFYVFDMPYCDGFDLTAVPLRTRKDALRALIPDGGTLRFSEHFEADGDVVRTHACRLSLEGIVSKRADGPYRSGRTKDWIKSKCSYRQEFVIGGYVPSTTSDKAIGSLVLGYYEDGRLLHAGRVGTGYSASVAEDLFRRLEAIRRDHSPFAGKLTAEAARQVRYVEPRLVAEVEFRAWTADDNIRHAAFRGLREDKPAEEVVRETGAPSADPAPAPARPRVKLTHPDRVYWPEDGVTKEGLADYYSEVWRRMAPYVVDRPLALLRCPGGIVEACFFQKHGWKGMSRSIRLVADPADDEKLIVIEDLDGLIGLVQGGALEIHPWGARLGTLEQPDTIILDLDPGEGVSWDAVVAAAEEARQRLEAAGLAAFLKTSGGKGLHVVAPLKPQAGWDEAKAFTKAIAEAMAGDDPERYVATITKSKRKGKILVDYLRNGRGATAVAPYSTRARPGAAVSMPIGWDELASVPAANYFTVATAPTRLARLTTDPWADIRKAAAPLPETGGGRRKMG